MQCQEANPQQNAIDQSADNAGNAQSARFPLQESNQQDIYTNDRGPTPEPTSIFSFRVLPLCISNVVYGYSFTLISASNYADLAIYYSIDIPSRMALSMMNGALPLGGILGILLVQYVLRVLTKKQGYVLSAVGMTIASGMTTIPSFGFLIVGRFILGIFCAISLFIAAGHLRNLSLINSRPITAGMATIGRIVGVLLCFILAIVFKFTKHTIKHVIVWMMMAYIAIIQAVLIYFITPNDPIELISKKKKKAGCKIMYDLYGSQAVKELLARYEYEFNPVNTSNPLYYATIRYNQNKQNQHHKALEEISKYYEQLKHVPIKVIEMTDWRQSFLQTPAILAQKRKTEIQKRKTELQKRKTELAATKQIQTKNFKQFNEKTLQKQGNPRLKFLLMSMNVAVIRHFCGLSFLIVYANSVLRQVNSPLIAYASIINNSVLLVSCFIGVYVATKFGRRPLIIVGGIILCLMNAALAIVDNTNDSLYELILMIVYMVPCGVVYLTSAQASQAEVLMPPMIKYPTLCGWIAQALVTLIPPYITQDNAVGVYSFFSVWMAIAIFCCWKWLHQSKGLSLQQIQANDPFI